MTENFAYGEINEWSFSNPHPRNTVVPAGLHTDIFPLTHWVRDKMAAISQTTFSHAFAK